MHCLSNRRVILVLFISVGLFEASLGRTATGQARLPGEFNDIELGRRFVGRKHFPTIQEVREFARLPAITTVATLVLRTADENLHLPSFSLDGQRLAVQQTQIRANSSKLLIFESLAQPAPTQLTPAGESYDYMFSWGISREPSYTFVRIDSRDRKPNLFYSIDEARPVHLPAAGTSVAHPAVVQRADGSHAFVVERAGEVVHSMWLENLRRERSLGRGTTPRWNGDGTKILWAREKRGAGRLADYQPAERDIESERELLFTVHDGVLVRTPAYSPSESRVAWYERDMDEQSPWRIVVASIDAPQSSRVILADVVLNRDFKSNGPCWEPTEKRIWCFSNGYRQQQYYPIIGVDIAGQQVTKVEHANEITSPGDLFLSPVSKVPEFVYVGHRGDSEELYVTIANHF